MIERGQHMADNGERKHNRQHPMGGARGDMAKINRQSRAGTTRPLAATTLYF